MSSRLQGLISFSQHMQETELAVTDGRVIISWTRPVRSRLRNRLCLLLGLSLLSLIAAMVFYVFDDAKIAALLVAVGLLSSLIALVFGLYRIGLKDVWIDPSQRTIGQGRSAWPVSRVCRMTIRRNTVNHCYRYPTVNQLADRELSNIQVIAHLGRAQRLNLGTFNATELAQQYATEVAQLIGFAGVREIDG